MPGNTSGLTGNGTGNRSEVGTRPSAETLTLLATVQSGDPGPARALGHRLPAALLRPPRLIGRDDELRRLREEWMPGTVALVPTWSFVQKPEDSPNPRHGHPEFGNAETYVLVGNALGKAMLQLLETKPR